MKNILRLEELGMFLFSIFLFADVDLSWWWYPLLILVPDFSMLGYLVNSKTGAILYNFVHHKGVAVIIWSIGLSLQNTPLIFTGLLLFGHSSMDRIFGYGLKYNDAFEHTHLGIIGKHQKL